jgi:hypothetical protein
VKKKTSKAYSKLDFHTRLIHELTALDRRNSTKRGYNPNALGIYFRAAENVTDAKSFADAFTPTRGMHTVAKNLGLPLGVERGDWIMLSENPRRRTVTRKKTRSAAQIRATKKMIAAARTRSRTKKKTSRRRNPVGNTIRGTYQNAVPPRNPPQGRRMNPVNNYGINAQGKWFDGTGWTSEKRNACKWGSLNACKRIAQRVSDNSGKVVAIHSM